MYLNDYFTVPMPLAGIPAISIPCGLSEGLPVGFQLASPAFSENRLLDAAYALEQAIGFDNSPARGLGRPDAGPAVSGRGAGCPAEVTFRMTDYEPVIGLEIHVQLSTRTKMFCGCELSFGEPPNTRTCEVCLGLPGALPVANAEAIHYGLLIGLALDCELAPRSIFHRKNYFYPDNAKNYQISQYDEPLCRGGRLGDVRIHRVHLEEDAAKLVHTGTSGRIHGAETSVVDFNRGGTPLVEIVSEPDVRSAEQAGEWLRLLRTTLRRLGVSDVNMEEGSLRCDANVSIRPVGTRELGTKTELKNMNSFRFIEKGIRAEIARQEAHRARGRRGGAGDAALRSAHRGDHVAALQGGGARLPLLPRARPGPDRDQRGDARARARGAARAARSARRALRARPRADDGLGPAAGVARRAGRLLRGRAVGQRIRTDPTPSRWPTGSTSSSRASTSRTRPSRRCSPGRWPRSSGS